MKPKAETTLAHQNGEPGEAVNDKQNLCEIETQAVEMLAGKTQVSWDFDSSVSRMGEVFYFSEFLKANGLFDSLIENCPLRCASNNAPEIRDALGTLLLSQRGILDVDTPKDPLRQAAGSARGLQSPQARRCGKRPPPAWESAGEGWSCCERPLRLSGWKESRRVVVHRRIVRSKGKALELPGEAGAQMALEVVDGKRVRFEYRIHVTNLDWERSTIRPLYQDRADNENCYDELKNQWGWAGYATRDPKRCGIAAQLVGLVYNWWSLLVKFA